MTQANRIATRGTSRWMGSRRRLGRLAAAVAPAALAPAAVAGLGARIAGAAPAGAESGGPATVYTMTNQPAGSGGNAVAVLTDPGDGMLAAGMSVASGGAGGSGLGNQGGISLSRMGRWLLAVNAGSNDVSVFRPEAAGLTLTSRTPSGGMQPISVALHRDLVYVLHDGGAPTINGFRLSPRGELSAVPGAVRPLSGPDADPAQVGFSPDGSLLVVTEKASNAISTFQVDEDGVAGPAMTQPSSGPTPFGFVFDAHRRDRLYVVEAFGGMPGASALSAYEIDAAGRLRLLDGSVPTHQTSACWLALTPDGRYAYTTNAASGSITGYRIGAGGRLYRLDGDGLTATTGAGSSPIDLTTDRDGRFLYVLLAGTDRVVSFAIAGDGALTPIEGGVDLPDGANGLAAR